MFMCMCRRAKCCAVLQPIGQPCSRPRTILVHLEIFVSYAVLLLSCVCVCIPAVPAHAPFQVYQAAALLRVGAGLEDIRDLSEAEAAGTIRVMEAAAAAEPAPAAASASKKRKGPTGTPAAAK